MTATQSPPNAKTERQDWMSLFAKAKPARLAALMNDLPDHAVLRGPETGTVMLRGRSGAVGAPFNLGEMTVTRCSVRLSCGTIGHAMVQGRDRAHALQAAVGDALMQTAAAQAFATRVLAPLRDEKSAEKRLRAEKAAATRVEFFTMVRGEDK